MLLLLLLLVAPTNRQGPSSSSGGQNHQHSNSKWPPSPQWSSPLPTREHFLRAKPPSAPSCPPFATTKARAAQLLEAPCRQTRARRARFDSGPKRQITLKGSAQGTGCLLWGRSSSSPASQSEKHAFRRGTSCFVARERLEGIVGGFANLL